MAQSSKWTEITALGGWGVAKGKSGGMWVPGIGAHDRWGLGAGGQGRHPWAESQGKWRTLPGADRLILLAFRSTGICRKCCALRVADYRAGGQVSLSCAEEIYSAETIKHTVLSCPSGLCTCCSISLACLSCWAPNYPWQFSSCKMLCGKAPFDPSHLW